MKIYTKQGDKGQTSLIGGQRVSKHHDRLHAYGSLDELNSTLGVIRSQLTDPMKESIDPTLFKIQNQLFHLGSHLACETEKARKNLAPLDPGEIAFLEEEIDRHQDHLPPLKQFILPGGHIAASYMHVARTICRRAERLCVQLEDPTTQDLILPYINRLSDLLYVLARRCNQISGQPDILWEK